jgi:acetylornithine/succinyldiaminopimelate/putrescine aminotransferase
MEVAEFALRVAATHTGRGEFVGFARSMHGKSAMTAALGWSNAPVRPANAHVLPFAGDAPEEAILDRLDALLRTGRVAALLVEPVQGSNAAREASIGFYDRAIALCGEHGALCIFDETLTGLHRTGTAFYSERLRERPDMLLFAKCLGNGFPVSSIALGEAIEVRAGALPGSTFSGNPMALAAAEATLTAMAGLAMRESVAAIGELVRSRLGRLSDGGVTLRGRGAFWCLEFGERARMERAVASLRSADVLVTSGDRFIRLLPAATIDPGLLEDACEKVARACAVV